ncbi:uncharacterized protein DUF1538 [Anaerobacterium chartisolvens]|uniref:Uncharacterized protein DUF1538 n=1 Tax=Anaerobacterium chartisolvens TaxID=1297424 RepID=A0A369AKQ6_9FIRM|nr:DUF1538 domain-containing protein [Anaerobacterium chartisolvens]RCX09989.1 uncharacterized protein DUF1538 [Anaerobacterium chartisolvens]
MNVRETLLEVVYSILPITLIVAVLGVTIGRLPAEDFVYFAVGTVMVILGLTLFFMGAKLGFLPIGEVMGSALVERGKLWLMVAVGFVMGFVVTVAEPDVQVLAGQVATVSEGAVGKLLLVSSVALGVGIAVALALLRMFLNVPLIYLLGASYLLVFTLGIFTSPNFLGVAFDSGGVTTGPMTVPFILALGVGVASVSSKKKSSTDSFGLVALASVGPILAVLILGVFYR